MRLIDADKIPVSLDMSGCAYEGNEYQAYKSGAEYIRELIDEQPTIDPEYKRPTTYIVGEQVPTEHIKDYNRTIALMFEDMVDFADRYGFSRDEIVNSMIYDMHTLCGSCDMNKYRPLPE